MFCCSMTIREEQGARCAGAPASLLWPVDKRSMASVVLGSLPHLPHVLTAGQGPMLCRHAACIMPAGEG